MAPVIDDPDSRTRRAEERAPDFYQAYLNSPDWRRTRNEALRRARYQCRRCGSRRDLNVHHRTYVRLGQELPDDLEVVCFQCHTEHHKQEATKDELGIYLKLVSEVIERNPFARIPDLAEDVKILCVKRKIPNQPQLLHKAINLVCATRLKDAGKPYRSVVEIEADGLVVEAPPISHAQAVELLARLRVSRTEVAQVVKPMPTVRRVTQHEADRVRAFELITREMEASIARCEALEAEGARQ